MPQNGAWLPLTALALPDLRTRLPLIAGHCLSLPVICFCPAEAPGGTAFPKPLKTSFFDVFFRVSFLFPGIFYENPSLFYRFRPLFCTETERHGEISRIRHISYQFRYFL
jgi:hypothetical protein